MAAASSCLSASSLASLLAASWSSAAQPRRRADVPGPINVKPPHVATDKSVKLDYDIVYVRAPRKGDDGGTNWAEIAHPRLMDAGADLMLLHPDGSEEVLVDGRRGLGHRPVRLLRRRVGLLRALPRPDGAPPRHGRRPAPTSTRSTSRRARSCG